MNMTVLTVLIFCGVLIVFGAIIAFLSLQEKTNRKKAIGLIQGSSGAAQAKKQQDDQNHRRASIAGKLKGQKQLADQDKKKGTLRDMIAQAGLRISIKHYWLAASGATLLVTALVWMIGQSPFVVVCAGLTALFGLPRLVLAKMASSRQKQFLKDFPDALEAVVRLLKAGMPVSEAIAMSAREFSGPIAEEMGRINDQQKVGVPLHEAVRDACHRMPLTEMNMFATSLSIQAQTGSSLSGVLMNLSGMIRARFRLKRKIKALASEAVSSAGIIGALPIVVAGGMYLTNKDYISVLFTHPFGQVLLGGAIIWMGLGVLSMKIMINFKV